MYIESRRRLRGFTLIELIIFIVVVGVGLTGILSVLNITVLHSSDPIYPKQALAIAEALMEEIQTKDFAAPASGDFSPSSPPGLAQRQNFDNVLDFNNYGASAIGPPVVLHAGISDITGTAIAALSAYRVLVTVVNPGSAPSGINATTDAWVITVQVTDPGGTVHTFTGYRLNYG